MVRKLGENRTPRNDLEKGSRNEAEKRPRRPSRTATVNFVVRFPKVLTNSVGGNALVRLVTVETAGGDLLEQDTRARYTRPIRDVETELGPVTTSRRIPGAGDGDFSEGPEDPNEDDLVD
jgi:hypothetical protein